MNKDDAIKVLYVDDEENNLKSFKASFRRYFNIYLASSVKEAEVILVENKIHVLITDQRMPVKLGTELLAEAVKKYPEQIRILLTAFADDEAIQDAVNRGQIFRYLHKPWNGEELKTAIEQGYEMYVWECEKKKVLEELQLRVEEVNLLLKQKVDSK